MFLTAAGTFTDPDEYGAAVRGSTTVNTIKERGRCTAKTLRMDSPSLWVFRQSINLARTCHVDILCERTVMTFQTGPGQSLVRNGVEVGSNEVTLTRLGHSYYEHSFAPASISSMSIPLEDTTALGESFLGQDLAPPKDIVTFAPSPGALTRARRLHDAACNLVEDAPIVLSHLEAARGLQQALIEAMLHCLDGGQIGEDRAALRQHAAIMRRFHSVIEEHLGEPLYITELCKEVGASLRTLNACCHEHLGMGAKHFLLLRRMHMVRRALRESSPADTTVTEIATRYGFWHFGRLAVEYKVLFGEAPSVTLAGNGEPQNPDGR